MATNYSDVLSRQVELSYVAPQNFYLVVEKLPELVLTLQQANVPTISGGEVQLENRVNSGKTYIPGDGVDYSQFDLTFLLDKEFRNYRSILDWLKQINAPENGDQFAQLLNRGSGSELTNGFSRTMSDMTLIGTGSDNKPIVQWNMKNAFPISLDGPQYDATSPDVDYLTSSVSFRYHYFTCQTYIDGVLQDNLI